MPAQTHDLRETSKRHPQSFIIETEIPGQLILKFPADGRVRSRKVVTRSRSRRTGKYPSWKMHRMVQWESSNELIVYRVHDADPSVIAFYDQPFEIHYFLDGEWHVHYPDILVRRCSELAVEEVKEKDDANSERVLRRTRFLRACLPRLGLVYRVVIVDKAEYKPALAYCSTVLKIGRTPVTVIERETARRSLEACPGLTWGSVADGALGKRGRNIVARLLLEGDIWVEDRAAPLTPDTALRWSHRPASTVEHRAA